MKKTLLFLILALSVVNVNAQCWKSASYGSAIKVDGSLWMWGNNSEGRIGDGTTLSKNLPLKIGTDTWKSVSSTTTHTVAIKTDGTLWAWGSNNIGQLGDGTNINKLSPVQVGTDNNWELVSVNNPHTLAIKTDGTLWAWGENWDGQLGDGTLTRRNAPVQIGTDTNWKLIYAAHRFSIAIRTDGTLWSWGANNAGQLGIGNLQNKNTPQKIGNDSDWVIASNYWACHAIKSNGTLWAWGGNGVSGDYYLGDGTTVANRSAPIQIGTETNWISLGFNSAIKSNGTLWGWGPNSNGLVGDGTNVAKPNPTQIGTATDWQQLFYSNKLKTDGTLWTNGSNFEGLLGNGTTVSHSLILVQIATTYCPATPIIANDDSGTALNGIAGTAVANVLSNDTYNSLPATLSNATLSFVSATNSGITLNTATGAVNVANTVPVGSYSLVYKICEATSTSNCDEATVAITVNPQTIDAVNDNFTATPIDYLTGGTTASVLSNDLVNGATANPSQVTITLTSNGGIAGAEIANDGTIDIPVATPVNTYTLQYTICLASNPTICDVATVAISVADRSITTPEIVFAIRANKVVYQSELQSTGKIIISGAFNKYNTIDAKYLTRLNTDLTLDTSFPAVGTMPDPPYDFKILANDKIIIVGTFTSMNGTPTGKGIARLNADGTVDTTFNTGGAGIGANDRILACAVQSDGKILLGGGFLRTYNGTAVQNMIRINADGTLDTSFNYHYTYNPSTFGSVHTINVMPNGKILVSGNYSRMPGGQTNLFMLNSNGSLDTGFQQARVGIGSYRDTAFCTSCIAPIQNIVLQPDGKILAVGAFDSFSRYTNKNIVRLHSDGELDTTFSSIAVDRVINDVVIEPDGKLIIGGEFTTLRRNSNIKLGRLNTNGTLDATFSSGSGPVDSVNPTVMPTVMDLNRQADGKVIVAGAFSHYNAISATNITRITPAVAGGQGRTALWNTEKETESTVGLIEGIKIYPNPSTGIFNIDLAGNGNGFDTILVYNALGQIVYKNNVVPEAVNEIDLSRLPNGHYYAKITGGNTSIQKVLLKK